ncbi:MAG: DUF3568 family protein [Verrucomicrobiota bacterium]|nr:DUF3568 family protein [Verrucomicrobiota bacterium]
MKISFITILSICAVIITGCTTQVVVDSMNGELKTAKYQAGFFTAPVDAPVDQIFKLAITAVDAMGYFRTGELHKQSSVMIYARKVGDQKVTVRIGPPTDEETTAQSEVRIRIGNLGNLAESQAIYDRIIESL